MSENAEIPLGWKRTKLGSICEFNYGKSLPKNNREHSGSFDVYGSNGIVGKHSKYLIDSPCIIVGRKGAAGEVQISMSPCWPIDTTYYILENPNYELKFLYYLLKSLQLSALDKSTAIPGLNRNDAYEKIICLPPLDEQSRIVAKIEELFSNLDKGIERLKAAQQQLKIYRQSVLKWAFEGRLTNKNAEKNQLPKGWKYVCLKDVCSDITDGDHQPPPKTKNGIPFITISNIDKLSKKISFEDVFHVSERYYNNLQLKRKPRNGDVLYTVTGSFGIPVLVDFDDPFCFQRHIALLRPLKTIDQKYLYYALQTNDVYKQADEKSTGTAQKTVALASLRNIEIPFAETLSDQKNVVEVIENRFSVCDKLEESIKHGLDQAEALRQSILKKAFEGTLVPKTRKTNQPLPY